MKYTGAISFVIICAGILGAMTVYSKKSAESGYSDAALETFAQCLAAESLTMYGAEWCSHCKREKALFGDAFAYVPYVECPENQKLCLDKGITGYPTWTDAAGTKYVGEQGLDRLSEISGCPLPDLK